MADSRLTRPIGLPIGPDGSLVEGTLLMNNNGDAEWFQKGLAAPSFTSNASNNYRWQPSPGTTVPSGQRQLFYATPASITTLNNARLQTWLSPTGYNSPTLARQLNVPGSNAAPAAPQGDQQGGNPQQSSQGEGASAPAEGTPSGDTPSTPDLSQSPSEIKNPILGELEIGKPLSVLGGAAYVKYPRDMKDDQDKIKFTAVEITKGGFGGEGLNFKFGNITYTPVPDAGSVFLAIQAPISDQNAVDWGPDSVNALDAAIFNKSLAYMGTNAEDIGTSLQNDAKAIYNAAAMQEERIRRYLAGQAASLNNVLSRTDSAVLNPNLELLFQGPQLRPFTFQFKMSARYDKEAEDIKKIIKYFKYFMTARKEKNGIFLRAPYVFAIEYMHKNKNQHPGINLISPEVNKKACALTNCSVDYTPLGTYMTYEEGTMVAYTLSLQFQEITPIYDTDYKDYPHPIGF